MDQVNAFGDTRTSEVHGFRLSSNVARLEWSCSGDDRDAIGGEEY